MIVVVGPHGDLDAVTCVELAHEGSEVGLDGADADVAIVGDLAVGPAAGDLDQDLLFTGGEGLDGLRLWGSRVGVIRPVGPVLDATALDWGPIMRHAVRARGLPHGLVPAVMAFGELTRRIDWRILDHLHDPAHLDLPVPAFHGEDDATVPSILSDQLAERLRNVRVERFRGAGHCCSVNVNPARYLRTFRHFLDSI